MTVSVRFICRENTGNARSGNYELPQGSSICDLLTAALGGPEQDHTDVINDLVFLVNNKMKDPETVLCDGDSILILSKVVGG